MSVLVGLINAKVNFFNAILCDGPSIPMSLVTRHFGCDQQEEEEKKKFNYVSTHLKAKK